MAERSRRRKRILELIERQKVRSQEQLRDMLRREGIETTQATLSRDLHELGVVKGPDGYLPPHATSRRQDNGRKLEQVVQAHLVNASAAGTLAILRTGPGAAMALAAELDDAQLRGVVGSLAGDDTVFLAASSASQAKRIAGELRRLAGLN